MIWVLAFLIFPVTAGLYARYWLHDTYSWQEFAATVFGILFVTGILYLAGSKSVLHDVEIWNGEITSKHRDQGSYIRTYSCNCITTTNSSGSTTTICQTCSETRYTVDWYANSTVGRIQFDSLDSGSRSVYSTPDPIEFTECQVGDPASRAMSYTNYVKAAPDSLFNTLLANQTYQDQIPEYPKIFGKYKINRVLTVDAGVESIVSRQLDARLSEELKHLGPTHQVNIITIVTGNPDPFYRHVVENAWIGGKKNDVVVFLGVAGSGELIWNDAMTWALNSGNELFVAQLNQRLADIGQLSLDSVEDTVQVITTTIQEYYIRPNMTDFEYLKASIEPPRWVMIACWMISFFATIALTILFHHWDTGKERWTRKLTTRGKRR
jgi:hypothetical protein